MKTQWQFHAGIDSIGGTIIELRYADCRLLFDMGRVFNPSLPVFNAEIQIRDIRDLQRLGGAPKIPGVFVDGSASPEGLRTMIAISHSHLDHIGLLPFVREDIPILLHEDTYKLIQALDVVGDGPGRQLQYQPVASGEQTNFGPFQITSIPVDHDTPGACAFLIETPDLRFVYSGDLRLHGAHPEWTVRFAEQAKEFQADVLFIEGTRADIDHNDDITSEPDVASRLLDVVNATDDRGVYFTFYQRHPDRLSAFQQAAREAKRTLVLQASSAYIFKQFGGDLSDCALIQFPDSTESAEVMKWINDSGLPQLSLVEIRSQEANYLVEFPYEKFIYLVDIEPTPGGSYIHSNGAPLGPFDPAWNNFQHWLKMFELQLAVISSTGHGSRADILQVVQTISPRVLMPIHSLKPWRIGTENQSRIMPRYQYTYAARDLETATVPSLEELQ